MVFKKARLISTTVSSRQVMRRRGSWVTEATTVASRFSSSAAAMKASDVIVLRTRIHPAVAMLDSLQIGYESFDTCYDNAETFEEVYSHIVDEVTGAAARGSSVGYAVPGHPCVGEKTVFAIRNKAMELGIDVEVIPAASFIDACMTALSIDPFEGLLVLDGADMRENEVPTSTSWFHRCTAGLLLQM